MDRRLKVEVYEVHQHTPQCDHYRPEAPFECRYDIADYWSFWLMVAVASHFGASVQTRGKRQSNALYVLTADALTQQQIKQRFVELRVELSADIDRALTALLERNAMTSLKHAAV